MNQSGIEKSVPRLIYVMGIDGSGKSTVSEHLAARLREYGYDVEVEWLRFNHVFTKPLLGICRLLGLTRYEVRNGIRVGYHDFHKSRFVSWMFIFLQYLDAWRVLYTRVLPKIRGRRKILILDRYVYDILVDVIVDTGFHNLLNGRTGKAFVDLLPSGAKLLLVDRDLELVLEARPEGRVDDNFIKRYRIYKEIAKQPLIEVINNDGELADLLHAGEMAAGVRT